jgi:hypothetical protein
MRRSSAIPSAGSKNPLRNPCCSACAFDTRSDRGRSLYSRASSRSTAASIVTAKYALATGGRSPVGYSAGGGALIVWSVPIEGS